MKKGQGFSATVGGASDQKVGQFLFFDGRVGMTSGTVNLTAGQYVLCNFNATGGTLNVQSGPVQIFIASPTSSLCSGNGYTEVSGSWNGGNFTAADGIDNTLTGTVNGIANPCGNK